MTSEPCVFDRLVPWTGDISSPVEFTVPLVLSDLTMPAFDEAALRDATRILATTSDAVLVAEHHDRPYFPPTLTAAMVQEAGVPAWVTLACRDRNRVVLEQELYGLARLGVGAVLCVTGDGRGYDVRPGVTQVFDVDGTILTSMAAGVGVVAAVPETPTAPPVELRPARLVEKQRAGASVAVLNHVPAASAVADFVAASRASGLIIPIVAAVAVYTDLRSAAVLQGLPGLALDSVTVAEVLDADDPVSAGIDAAVREAQSLLAISGVEGVNLSGSGTGEGHLRSAEIKAEIGRQIRML